MITNQSLSQLCGEQIELIKVSAKKKKKVTKSLGNYVTSDNGICCH